MKSRNFTFSLKSSANDLNKINELVQNNTHKYAYITHDKDKNENNELIESHNHYYIEFTNPRELNSIAKFLDIPPNLIQKVFSKISILNYLTHNNTPEKYQYDYNDIKTNFDIKADCNIIDINQEYVDLQLLKSGLISKNEFLSKYKTQISSSNYFNRLKIYNIVYYSDADNKRF